MFILFSKQFFPVDWQNSNEKWHSVYIWLYFFTTTFLFFIGSSRNENNIIILQYICNAVWAEKYIIYKLYIGTIFTTIRPTVAVALHKINACARGWPGYKSAHLVRKPERGDTSRRKNTCPYGRVRTDKWFIDNRLTSGTFNFSLNLTEPWQQ